MYRFKSRLIAELIVVLVLIAIGLLLNVYIGESDISNTFQKLSTYPYDDKETTFNFLIIGTLGCYFYLLSNAYRNFNHRVKLFILLGFGLITLLGSIQFMSILKEIENVIRIDFSTIPFPTEPDIVQKNVKLNVLNSLDVFNISFVITGLISIIVSIVAILKLKNSKG